MENRQIRVLTDETRRYRAHDTDQEVGLAAIGGCAQGVAILFSEAASVLILSLTLGAARAELGSPLR